jgi:hypothetical protein
MPSSSPLIIAALTAPSSPLAAVTPSSPSSVDSSGKSKPAPTLLFYFNYDTFHVASTTDLTQEGGSRHGSDSFNTECFYNSDSNACSGRPYPIRYQCGASLTRAYSSMKTTHELQAAGTMKPP